MLGRDRAVVSRILNGHQKLSIDQAQVIAEALDLPIDQVLVRAGLIPEAKARSLSPGYSGSDVVLLSPGSEERNTFAVAAALHSGNPDLSVWRVKSTAMTLAGYLPGDCLLIDTLLPGRTAAGDVVIASVAGLTADRPTVLRRHEPPVLVAAATGPEYRNVYVVDQRTVEIRGKVLASWRRT